MNYSQDIIWIMIRDGIMMYNNLNINNNSTVHSIASTTNSNQHRESFPYELCKIQPNCYSNMEMVMRVLMVMMVVMMMMMIPMKSSLMVVLMATISPLREGIPLAEICLPKRPFSLGVFCLVVAAESFCGRSPSLRVSGG